MEVTPRSVFANLQTGLHVDPKNMTMNKKLVINVAPCGAFVKRSQNPHQPYTPREIARHAIDSYHEGARVWHVHCREEDGIPTSDAKVMTATIGAVLAECPDIITSVNVTTGDYATQGVDRAKPIVEPLLAAGPRYIQTAVISPVTRTVSARQMRIATRELITDQVVYLQERGIKCEFQCHNYTAIKNVVDWLIEPGVLRPPYMINVISGFHGYEHSGPTSPDPWGIMYLATMLQYAPPGSAVGATIGGHNWLPLTVVGMILGADMVRVGMEDTLWMYPHRDDLITRSADAVRKVATIAREMGREIASPAEARQILGLTS